MDAILLEPQAAPFLPASAAIGFAMLAVVAAVLVLLYLGHVRDLPRARRAGNLAASILIAAAICNIGWYVAVYATSTRVETIGHAPADGTLRVVATPDYGLLSLAGLVARGRAADAHLVLPDDPSTFRRDYLAGRYAAPLPAETIEVTGTPACLGLLRPVGPVTITGRRGEPDARAIGIGDCVRRTPTIFPHGRIDFDHLFLTGSVHSASAEAGYRTLEAHLFRYGGHAPLIRIRQRVPARPALTHFVNPGHHLAMLLLDRAWRELRVHRHDEMILGEP